MHFSRSLWYNQNMMDENNYRQVIAKNLIKFRKAFGLTQLELAEKLNYSDKAISKWERGESLPDIYVLQIIADMFGITLNDLVSEETPVVIKPQEKMNKDVIITMSIGLIWLIAVINYLILKIADINVAWITFLYAIPISAIVAIVFAKLWKYRKLSFLSVSSLYYSIPLCVGVTLHWAYRTPLLFIVAAPLQILTILWYFRKKKVQ